MTSLRTLLSLALGALLAVPLSAGAAVTATTISQPVTDPSVLVFVEPTGVPLTVSGTSNGGTGRLDLRCEGAATPVVDANVRPRRAVCGRRRCRGAVSALTHMLPAGVPHGAPDRPRRVRRQRVLFGARVRRRRGERRRPPTSLLGARLLRPVDQDRSPPAGSPVDDRATSFHSAQPSVRRIRRPTSGRAGVLIDHANAYMPSAAATLFNGSANALGLLASQTSISTDPSTGNVLIRETENLLRCSPDAATLPATALTCSSFVSAGVKLDRLIIQQGDGRQALVTDTWSSTDGRHHQVDVFYEDRLGGTAPVVSSVGGGFTSYPGFTQTRRDGAVPSSTRRPRR